MIYIIKKLLQALFVVFCVLSVVFLLVRLTGDPATLMAPIGASQQEIDQIRQDMGFNRPIYDQYINYIGNALRGDFGNSVRYEQPAMSIVLERLPATLELTIAAFVFMVVLGIPLGIFAAIRKNSLLDLAASSLALFGQSVPVFWLGIVLILLFSVTWPLFPSSGHQGFLSLVMPAITLGAFSASLVTRMTRSSLLEILDSNYITTCRAKGLSEGRVILKHALKNASIPIMTIIGLQVGPMLGGAIITEQVFGFPGMARLAMQAVLNRDFPIVQAFVVVVSALIVLINFSVDIIYYFLDPRLKHE